MTCVVSHSYDFATHQLSCLVCLFDVPAMWLFVPPQELMREKAAVGEEMTDLRASHAREVALLQDQLHTVRESVAAAKQQAELARQALQVAVFVMVMVMVIVMCM
jgi:alkanesulfonate monooxygenase SsuD/methylene tetrahydromethanopterin reductase-like flavin-dependent oxidoreductase (luciferase family)